MSQEKGGVACFKMTLWSMMFNMMKAEARFLGEARVD